jgi:hypothetical protein
MSAITIFTTAHPFRTLQEQLNRFIGELDSDAYAALQAAENEEDLKVINKNDFAIFTKRIVGQRLDNCLSV